MLDKKEIEKIALCKIEQRIRMLRNIKHISIDPGGAIYGTLGKTFYHKVLKGFIPENLDGNIAVIGYIDVDEDYDPDKMHWDIGE